MKGNRPDVAYRLKFDHITGFACTPNGVEHLLLEHQRLCFQCMCMSFPNNRVKRSITPGDRSIIGTAWCDREDVKFMQLVAKDMELACDCFGSKCGRMQQERNMPIFEEISDSRRRLRSAKFYLPGLDPPKMMFILGV